MTPTGYLALLATARPLYVWLYRDALDVLPPVDADTPKYVALEVHTGLAGIAKGIGWSHDVVRREMARLVNYNWVQGARVPRLLGHREGHKLYLLADLAAEQHTEEQSVVSTQVLHRVVTPEVPSRRDKALKKGLEGRGTNRVWGGTQGEAWGSSKGTT